jgi:putative copper resistance protein D
VPGPSFADLATDWSLDPAAAVVAVGGACSYAIGVRRLGSRDRRWPRSRSIAVAAAIAVVAVATQSGIATHEGERLAVHMAQHVLLGMVLALALALSAPVTLLLQSGGPATRSLTRRALQSRAGALVANPLLTWSLFGGSLVALYLTPALDVAARHPWLHALVHVHIVVVGCLFLWPLVSTDVLPHRLSHGARLLSILVAVPFHAFLGAALLGARAPIAPDTYPDLADQRTAAGILWASGELLTLAVAAMVFAQWWAAEHRAEARELRAATRSAAR